MHVSFVSIQLVAVVAALAFGDVDDRSAIQRGNLAFVGRAFCVLPRAADAGPSAVLGLPNADEDRPGVVAVVDLRSGRVDRVLRGESDSSFGRHVAASGSTLFVEAERAIGEGGKKRPELQLWSTRTWTLERTIASKPDERALGTFAVDLTDSKGSLLVGAKLEAGGHRCIALSSSLERVAAVDVRPLLDASVCTRIGDVDADGIDDVVLQAGEHLELHSGRDLTLLRSITDDDVDGFGASVAALDDLDGDGVRDFAIGCPQLGRRPTRPAFVRFVSGRTSAKLRDVEAPDGTHSFGYAMTTTPDLDGDGVRDLFVTSYALVEDGVTAVSAKTGSVLWTGPGSNGESPDVGRRVVRIDDVDGDAIDDVLATRSSLTEDFADHAGLVWFSGKSGASLGRIEALDLVAPRAK